MKNEQKISEFMDKMFEEGSSPSEKFGMSWDQLEELSWDLDRMKASVESSGETIPHNLNGKRLTAWILEQNKQTEESKE